MELPKTEGYGPGLIKAAEKGELDILLINRAVKRILEQKFRLGLFENPFGDPDKIPELFGRKETSDLALQIARESIVLLKNDKILPLSVSGKTLAVIGPNADSLRNLFGDYTYGGHLEGTMDMLNSFGSGGSAEDMINGVKGLVCGLYSLDIGKCTFEELKVKYDDDSLNQKAVAAMGQNPRDFPLATLWDAVGMVRQMESIKDFPGIRKLREFRNSEDLSRYLYHDRKTVLEAVRNRVGGKTSVFYAEGCDILSDDRTGFADSGKSGCRRGCYGRSFRS